MIQQPIRFDDGEAYEHGMGVWSRSAGSIFLDWVAPEPELRWVDIGCGNGAFTELLIARCTPSNVQAIDPSEGQLAFARTRPGTQAATFHQGDAMALPIPDASFDAAVMALVLFFVPDPAKGLSEMLRVVCPGGLICAYVWDVHAGGLPIAPIQAALRAIGVEPAQPPSADISRMEALQKLWISAGLEGVDTLEIMVERRFADFDAFWRAGLMVGSLGERMATLTDGQVAEVKARVRPMLAIDAEGTVVAKGRANAVKGRRPQS
jgi:SAM-dependent methyltransferase